MPTMPSTLASAESKRAANRVAQRKFRRQHKDYVTRLEKELELSRAGASEELRHHQQEIKRLKDQQLKFRRLIDSVIKNMRKIVGDNEDLDMYEDQRSEDGIAENGGPHGQMLCGDSSQTSQADQRRMLSNTRHAERDDATSELTAAAPRNTRCTHCFPGGSAASTAGIESMSAPGSPRSAGHSTIGLEDVEPARYQTQALGTLTTLEQAPIGIGPHNNMSGLTPVHEKNGLWDASETVAFSQSMHMGDPTGVATLEHIGQTDLGINENHMLSIDTSGVELVDMEDNSPPMHSNLTHILPLDRIPQFQQRDQQDMQLKLHHLRSSQLACPESRVSSVIVRTSLVPLVFFRRVSDFLDSYLTPERLQTTPLDVFQAELAGKLAEVVVCVMDSYLRMLNVKDFAMYRGSAWVLWHIAKSELVLPRLRTMPIFANVFKNPTAFDIFCESRPCWMQPTDLQKTLQ